MEKLKVGIVGCGVISGAHIKAWRKTETCRVEGVFDVGKELAEKRAKEFQISRVFENLDDLIEACDVVDICTPPHTHAEIAIKTVRAGKHLLIEKPLVTQIGEWDELQKEAERTQANITVIHNLKFSHSVQQAKKWIDEGRIGKVFSMARQFLTSPENDRMLVGNTHWSHKLPGGRWFETMPHELYLFHYLVGPLELKNVAALHTPKAPAGAPADEVLITMQNDECIATIQFSANCQMNKRMLYIYGTKGIITVDILSDYVFLTESSDAKWKRAVGLSAIDAGAALMRTIPDRSHYALRHGRGDTPHSNIITAFDRFIAGKGPAPTPMDEVDYVVRNCDRIGKEIDRQIGVAAAA